MNEKLSQILKKLFLPIQRFDYSKLEENEEDLSILNFFNRIGKTRTVYRFVNEDELKALNEGDVDNLGHHFTRFNGIANNHKYQKDEKYLHFFDDITKAHDILVQLEKDKHYLCSYNIENSVLNRFKGKGFYDAHGYKEDYSVAREYAIPTSEFKIEWFNTSTPIDQYMSQKELETQAESLNNLPIQIELPEQ